MHIWAIVGIGVLLVAGTRSARAAGVEATPLQPGQKAPDVQLPGSDGKGHWLRSHQGKKTVVLAFFPKANTGG
jgi:peroxiredoxin Q/BCP